MKKDIEIPVAEGVAIAVIPSVNQNKQTHWQVFFVNLNDVAIDTVLIQVSGEGVKGGKEKETGTMRFMLHTLQPGTAKPFELLLPESLSLTHRYWVSYYIGNILYDKKIIISPGTIEMRKTHLVPVILERGILIQ